jgi:type II secretory pathway component PulK
MNRSQGNLPGRININTAPMEVIRAAIPPNYQWNADSLAKEIVAYRNGGPFARIGDLLDIPDFTLGTDPNGSDPIIGDIEDRDWILSRIANIFTVRSDVFTAYILVRIGHDGPKKRMIAIFDRSGVYSAADKPRLVALHPVPDPR